MKQNPTDRSSDTYDFDYHIYEKLPEKLKADPKLAAIALDHRPERLENGVIPKVLTKDRKFMMEEIEKMPTYIPDHLPEELSSDSEFIKEVATRMLFITKDRIDEDYDTYVPHKKMVEDIHNIETAQDEANLIYDLYVERYTGPESNAKQEIYKEAALRHIKEEYLSGKYPDTLYENNVRALLASDKVFVIQAAEASEMPVEDMIDKYVPNEAKQHMRTEIIGIKDAAQKTEHKEYVIKDASEFSLDKFKEFEQKKYEQDKGIDSPEHENDVKSKPSNMYDENDGDHDAI